jgi:hypothetical protein
MEGFAMTRKGWPLIGLATWLVIATCWGTECRFFRIGCLEGGAPDNLAITSGESGQILLEFDTEDQSTYVIQATDSLWPWPWWAPVSSITGDGQRARWLTGPWSRTYGGQSNERARCVQQTSDGGFIIAGYTSSFGAGYEDVYLLKTDRNGKEEWSKTFGGSDDDRAFAVEQTSDGGYIVAGGTRSFGAGQDDVFLLRTDADGDQLWLRTFGGAEWDSARSVQQTSDGGFIVAGTTTSFGAGFQDVYLIKTDNNGYHVWPMTTFGGTGIDWGNSVRQTSDGGYIVAGSTGSFGAGSDDAYLIKVSQSGFKVWSKTFGGTANDSARSVRQTSDGGYILAGATTSFGAGGADFYLIKTDGNGNEVGTRTFGGTSTESGYSVQQTSDGGFIVAGTTTSFGAGQQDIYLVRIDPTGNEVWSRTFGGNNMDVAECVQKTSDGGYIVVGWTQSFGAGLSDVYLMKTDADGNAPLPQ